MKAAEPASYDWLPHGRHFIWKMQCSGSGMFIPHPDPYFSISDSGPKRSRIWVRSKEFKYFYPKKLFLGSRKYDPGCSCRIPDLDFFPIPDPGIKWSTGSRICNTENRRSHVNKDNNRWLFSIGHSPRHSRKHCRNSSSVAYPVLLWPLDPG